MDKAKELIDKYFRNECTPQEKQFLDRWFHELNLNSETNLVPNDYEHARRLLAKKSAHKKVSIHWQRWAAAAAAILIIATISLYTFNFKEEKQLAIVSNTEIKSPLLVVDNSRKFVLDNKEILIEEVEQQKDAQGNTLYVFENKKRNFFQKAITNTLMTPRQQTLKMQLPDGSMVWLNFLSEISFNADFENGDYRNVTLKGEAYFEVAKNPDKPFRVITSGQKVEVLGTHFNINTNQRGHIATSLLEGSVEVSNNSQTAKMLLKPGQQSVLAQNNFRINSFDADLLLDWKRGDFLFKKDLLQNILKKLGDWYDVSFSLDDNNIAEQTFTGRLSRKSTLDECLFVLENSCEVKFEKDGAHKYRITKNITP